MGGTHIHHLVWGILLLLITGYVGRRDRAALAMARDRRGAVRGRHRPDARRVRPVAQPEGRLLVAAGTALDRRGDHRRDDHRDGAGRLHRLAGRGDRGRGRRVRDRGRPSGVLAILSPSSTWPRRSSASPWSASSSCRWAWWAPSGSGRPHSLWARLFYREQQEGARASAVRRAAAASRRPRSRPARSVCRRLRLSARGLARGAPPPASRR